MSWLFHPVSRPDDALDVTPVIYHDELAPRVLAHLARTGNAANQPPGSAPPVSLWGGENAWKTFLVFE